MKRLAVQGLLGLLMIALLLSTGCAGSIATMVVKHVAMSAAKEVAKDQYNQYKGRKAADRKKNANPQKPSAARPVTATEDDSADAAAP